MGTTSRGARGVLPFVLDRAQLAARYRSLLDRRSDAVIELLRSIVPAPVPDGVTGLELGLFVAHDDGWAPDVWLRWTGPHPRLTAGDEGVHAGAGRPLELDLAGVVALDPAYLSDEFGGAGVLADVLVAWLAECWWKAGGWDAPVAAELVQHDGRDAGRTVRLSALA
jgi:hypothetical protein